MHPKSHFASVRRSWKLRFYSCISEPSLLAHAIKTLRVVTVAPSWSISP